jgi:hypothetical protein
MLRPGDPREGNKKTLDKKLRDPKKNDKIKKTRPNQEDGRSHHEPAHYVHRYLAV